MRALITGATGQLGRACAQLLTLQGWQMVGVSRGGSHLADYRAVDLSDQNNTIEFAKSLPGLDLVVMTHGIQIAATLGHYTDTYDKVRLNNLDSAVYLTDALIHFDKLNPGALIIYCSSIHATQPRAGRGPYCIAKAGLEGLTRIVAMEGAPNIRAIGLRLGQLTEPMKGISFTPEQFKSITDKLLLPPVKAQNVARFCLELYYQTEMTGCVIDMDSGHSINIWQGID